MQKTKTTLPDFAAMTDKEFIKWHEAVEDEVRSRVKKNLHIAENLPDFAAMTDKELSKWEEAISDDINEWSEGDFEAVMAHAEELSKRREAKRAKKRPLTHAEID